MAYQPRNGELIFVRPLVPLASDEHRRPLPAPGKLVAWGEHYQRSYDAGDIEASRNGLPLSHDHVGDVFKKDGEDWIVTGVAFSDKDGVQSVLVDSERLADFRARTAQPSISEVVS